MYLSEYLAKELAKLEKLQKEANETAAGSGEVHDVCMAYYYMGAKHEIAALRTKLANGEVHEYLPPTAG